MLTLHYRKLILRTNILPLHSRILPNWASQRWNHEVINCFHLQGLSSSKRAMLEDRDRKSIEKVFFTKDSEVVSLLSGSICCFLTPVRDPNVCVRERTSILDEHG